MNTQEFYTNMKTEQDKIRENIQKIKNRIVVFSGKGGVGKTMMTINLAYELSKKHKVGILDSDVTAPNIPKMLKIKDELRVKDEKIIPIEHKGVRIVSSGFMAKENDAIIWMGPLRSKLINQFLSDVNWQDTEYLLADLPPGTGDEVLTITQSMKPNIAIIITTPQEVSLGDARRAIAMAKKMNIPHIYLIENMSYLKCPNCGAKIDLFGEGNTRKLSEETGVELIGEIPLDIEVRKGTDEGKIGVLEFEESEFSQKIKKATEKILEVSQ